MDECTCAKAGFPNSCDNCDAPRDYLAMPDIDALRTAGVDAFRWAEWFSQVAATHGLKVEPDWMQTWFANAMMAMADHIEREETGRLKAALDELACGFEAARDKATYMAEARRLDSCAKFCRDAIAP